MTDARLARFEKAHGVWIWSKRSERWLIYAPWPVQMPTIDRDRRIIYVGNTDFNIDDPDIEPVLPPS